MQPVPEPLLLVYTALVVTTYPVPEPRTFSSLPFLIPPPEEEPLPPPPPPEDPELDLQGICKKGLFDPPMRVAPLVLFKTVGVVLVPPVLPAPLLVYVYTPSPETQANTHVPFETMLVIVLPGKKSTTFHPPSGLLASFSHS